MNKNGLFIASMYILLPLHLIAMEPSQAEKLKQFLIESMQKNNRVITIQNLSHHALYVLHSTCIESNDLLEDAFITIQPGEQKCELIPHSNTTWYLDDSRYYTESCEIPAGITHVTIQIPEHITNQNPATIKLIKSQKQNGVIFEDSETNQLALTPFTSEKSN